MISRASLRRRSISAGSSSGRLPCSSEPPNDFSKATLGRLETLSTISVLRTNHGFLISRCSWLARRNGAALPGMPGQPRLRAAKPATAVEGAKLRLKDSILAVQYWQFEFFRQWQELRSYATRAGIRIVGDIPIYVALDSADVWTNREYFYLSEDLHPQKIAGFHPTISAPPDSVGAIPSTDGTA